MSTGGINAGSIYSRFELRTEDAERRLEKIGMEMEALRRKTMNSGQSVDQLEAEFNSLAMEAGRLEKALSRAGNSAQTIQLGPVTRSTRNLGMAAMETSRGIEDLQYGFNGIVNNIPGMVMAFGGTMGLTAVISLVAIAANQLVLHWDSLMDALGTSSGIQNATEEMEKLEAVTRRTADEEDRYQTLIRARQAGNAQATATTTGQDAQAKAVRDAVVASPQAAIIAGLRQSAPGMVSNPEIEGLRKEQDGWQARFDRGDKEAKANNREIDPRLENILRKRMEETQEKIDRAETEKARDLLGDAETNPNTLRDIVGVIRQNPQSFPGGVADRLEYAGGAPGREATERTQQAFGKFWGDLKGAVLEEAEKQSKASGIGKRIFEALDLGFGKEDRLTPAQRKKRADEELAMEGELAEAADAENLDRFRKQREENREKAEEVASQLLGGGMGSSLISGGAGEDEIAEAMKRSGFSDDTAGRRSGQVSEIVREQVDAMIRERSIASGVTEDDARTSLTLERRTAESKSALSAAEAVDPGIKSRTDRQAVEGLMAGGSLAQVSRMLTDGITTSLKAAGLSGEQAELAAKKLSFEAVGESSGMLGEYQRNAAEAMRDDRRSPEMFDAGQLFEKVQAGVGNRSHEDKIEDLNEKMVEHLRTIAEREQRDEVARLS